MSRGRDATSPTQMPRAGWLDVGARVLAQVSALNITLLAAGVAFYGLLSLFPAITAGVAVVGLMFDPQTLLDRADWLLQLLPQSAAALIEGQVAEVAGSEQGALGLAAVISIAVAIWSSSAAMGSLVQGLNLINEEEDTRGFIKGKLLVIALTLAMLIGLALAVTIVAAIPAALALLGAGPMAQDLAMILRWPLMFVLGVLGIAALYRFGPDRARAKWRWLTPGATLGCLVWVAGTYGFSVYVQSFGSYNETFGTLAGVVVLLTWMWLSAFIILLGAQLDAELEAQTARDSTVGEPRPMGERGAVKADTLGETRESGASDDGEDGQKTQVQEPQRATAR